MVFDATIIYESNQDTNGVLQPRLAQARIMGALLGRVGPILWERVGSDGVFGIMSISYVICAICAAVMEEVPKLSMVKAGGKGYACRALSLIVTSLRHPILQSMLFFNIVTGLIPSASTPTFYFLNDIVKMAPYQITLLHVCGDVTGLVSAFIFEKCFMNTSIRVLYAIVCVMKLISGFLPYALAAPETDCEGMGNQTCYYFQKHNIEPFPLALGDNVLGDAMDTLQSMPLNIVTKTVCFHVLGATVYTFNLALQNMVTTFRIYIDSVMMQWFGIDHGAFESLAYYIEFCTVLDGIGLILTPLLPKESIRGFEERMARERCATDIVEDLILTDEDLTSNSITPFKTGARILPLQPDGSVIIPLDSIAGPLVLPDGTVII